MSRTGALRSRVAVFVCVALLSSLVLPAFAQTRNATATAAGLRVAVGLCTDGTNGAIPGVPALLEHALVKSLADQPGIEVVPLSSGAADRVVSARLATLDSSKKGAASVEVVAEAADSRSGQVLYRTTVIGEGVRRPSDDSTAAVARAVGDAAEKVAVQVVASKNLRIAVLATAPGGEVTIDRGAGDGLVPGAELEVVRAGDIVARIRIDQVRDNTATGRLFDVKSGVQVEAGDFARVSSLPSGPTKAPGKKSDTNMVAIVAGVLVVGAIALFATKRGGHKSTANDGSRLTLVAANTSLPADGTSKTTLTLTYRDSNGNPPADGTVVEFSTNRGLIAPAQAETAAGQATATLTTGTVAGTATVTAVSGSLHTTVAVRFTATSVKATARHLYVLTSAEQIPADGKSTATITAVVGDASNTPVPDGTPVNFSTTRGLIAPAKGLTTSGSVDAALRSSTQAGFAQVAVKVGTLTGTVKVEFVASGASGRRTLFVTHAAARIPADGASTTTITATVKTASNTPVPDGTQVAFTSTAGTVFPAHAGTANGVATATLRSDPKPHTARVTAAVGSLQASTTVVFVSTGSTKVANIFLTRDPVSIAGDGVTTSKITATLRDASNNPVPDGTSVIFTTTHGLVSPRIGSTANGAAEATLRSEPTAADVTATITAAAGGQQAATTVKFTGTGAGPTRITVVADRTNLPANGTATANLSVTLVDPNGSPVSGANVTLTTTAGKLQVKGTATWLTQVTGKTNSQGILAALLRSTSNPDTATVTVSAPSVTSDTASTTVSFTSLVISSVTADPSSVPVGGNKSSKVTATIVDTIGNPAPDGTVVQFSIVNQAQLPSATIARSASTQGGQATAIFRSGAEVGTARIRVSVPSAGATNDQTIIGITAGPPALVTVAVDKFVTSARDLSKDSAVTVTALISDQFDNPVEDGTAVRFDLTPHKGGVITGTSTTTGGFATATLYPTGFVGDVTIIASTTGAGGVKVDNSARPTVVHMGGAPVSVAIVSPNAGSYSSSSPLNLYTAADQALVVQVKDSSGGPADPTVKITFEVNRGAVSPDPALITAPLAGTATATYRSDQPTPTGGVDTIVAVCEGVHSAPLFIVIAVNPAT